MNNYVLVIILAITIAMGIIQWLTLKDTFAAINADDYTECEQNSPECIPDIKIEDPFTKLITEFKKNYEKKSDFKFENPNSENTYIFPHTKKFKNIIEAYLNNNQYTVVADFTNIKSENNTYRFSTSINDKVNFFNLFVIITIQNDNIIEFEILKAEIGNLDTSYSNQQTPVFKLKNKMGLFYPFKSSHTDNLITDSMINNFTNFLKEKYKKLN